MMFNPDRVKEFKALRIKVEVPEDTELAKLAKSILDENGNEFPNPIPKEIPTDERSQLTLSQQVTRIMNHHLIKRQMTVQGYETEEEANDFDTGEETDFGESIYQEMDSEIPAIIDNNPDVAPEADPLEQPAEPAAPGDTAEETNTTE